MAFATAFQSDAFQRDAFQIAAATPIDSIGSPGIGAVQDFRGIDRRQEADRQREAEWRNDLRRVIDEAFDGKPPEPTGDILDELLAGEAAPDRQWLYDLVEAQKVRLEHERIARNNQHALELLLMVS